MADRPQRRIVSEVEVSERLQVMHLVGRLDIPGALELRRELRRAKAERPWLVLDLAGVPEMDGCALDVLHLAAGRFDRAGTTLALWRVRTQPLSLVLERGFHRVVPVISGPLDDWLTRQSLPAPRAGARHVRIPASAHDVHARRAASLAEARARAGLRPA